MLENKKLNISLIVLGVILIFAPYLGSDILQKLSGLLLLIIFLFIFFKEFKNDKYEIVDRRISIGWLIISILCLLGSISIIFSFFLFDYISSFWMEFIGLMLIANSGMLFYLNNLDYQEATFKVITGALGIFYIFMGMQIINPMYVGIVMGIFMAGYGYLMISQ